MAAVYYQYQRFKKRNYTVSGLKDELAKLESAGMMSIMAAVKRERIGLFIVALPRMWISATPYQLTAREV